MVTKSKLKMALAAEKGVDFKKLHLKKKEKAARKGKAIKQGGDLEPTNGNKVEEEWEDLDDEDDEEGIELDDEESGSEEEADQPMNARWLFRSEFHC